MQLVAGILLLVLAVLGWLALYWWLFCREERTLPPKVEPLPPEFWERWREANETDGEFPTSPKPFDKMPKNPYDSDKPGGGLS